MLQTEDSTTGLLCKGVSDDFDVCVHNDGSFDIFCVSLEGALLHICHHLAGTTVNTVLGNRTQDSTICNVRAFAINGRFHIFYCLNRREKLLVHHIAEAGNYQMTPTVIDYIGDKCIYDAVAEPSGDIHIIYQGREDRLVTRKYAYSSKNYLAPYVLFNRKVLSLCMAQGESGYMAAYVSPQKGRYSVVLCDLGSQSELVVARGVSSRSEVVLFPSDGGMAVQWTEGSMCFEADCTGETVRVRPLGRTRGIALVKAVGGQCLASRAAVNSSGGFFNEADLVEWNKESKSFVPKGYDVDELSRRYVEVLKSQSEKVDLGRELARIEASLEKLVLLVQKALEEDTPSEDSEYSVEEEYKEE